ncbi:unnamed protein product [Caenorhabditis angaria]|uniref:FH2 domain-containing protein n=1 Tax=Caenorhabditis angaria TaxID=860376 RepID=A0A9P1N0Q2_9PELO|nr:unnamed protein product [Caenorhabditis angaria]
MTTSHTTLRQTIDEILAQKNEARLYFLTQILESAKNVRTISDAQEILKIDTNSNILPAVAAPPAPPPPPPPPPIFLAPKIPAQVPGPPPPPPMMMKIPAPNLKIQNLNEIQKNVGKVLKDECPNSMAPKKEKKIKTKSVQWSKIKRVEENSVWANLAKSENRLELNFEMLDNFFGIGGNEESETNFLAHQKSRKSEKLSVELLTAKRSQNLAIMLKQFKNVDGFLADLRANKPLVEADAISNLFSILPAEDEEDALRRYPGDINLLSAPSAFFYRLVQIDFYRLRLETLMFLSDFSRLMQEFGPNIETLIIAAEQILKSRTLPKMLLILVNMGNYLNFNNSQGNASGFTLNSMWKLIDLKGNRQEFSLLHLLVTHDSNLVGELENELSSVKEAAQISFEEIKNSLRSLKQNRSKLELQLEKRESDANFAQFIEIIKIDCNFELKQFEERYETLVEVQKKLAGYFCENPQSFQLDECIKIFSFLLIRLHQTHKEHVLRELRKSRKIEKNRAETINNNNDEELENIMSQKKENVNLFDTLANSSCSNSEITRKRASDIHDIRQKLGNIRVRKIRDICPQVASTAEIREPVVAAEKSTTAENSPSKISPIYESCNDLESYITNLHKKRTSFLQQTTTAQKSSAFPPAALIPEKIPEVAVPTPSTTSKEKPTPTKIPPTTTTKTLIKKPQPTVRIVSVTPQKEPTSKMAELRRPKILTERKITPPPPPAVQKVPVVKVAAPSRLIPPQQQKPLASRRASAPVVRKPVVDIKKKEITVKPTVSTSARPSLINTCSSPTSRSSLPKLSVLEKPKPLRTTPTHKLTGCGATTPSPTPQKSGLRQPSKPKWI